jgi:hypothetical protein
MFLYLPFVFDIHFLIFKELNSYIVSESLI